ncbi:MAG: carboxypeptidase-like regulatory domain-containing protein, partial [Planctomycetota bacterium]
MAGIGAGLAAGAAGTASAVAATAGAAGAGASTGIAAVMSTVTAKVITAAAVAAITVGGVFTYKHLSQPEPQSIQTDEIAVVSVGQELILAPDESTEPDSQGTSDAAASMIEVSEIQTENVTSDLHIEDAPKIEIATVPSNADLASAANLDEKSGRLVKVYVTDKETDNPIEKATVYVHSRESIWTDGNGYCELRWDKNDKEYGKIMPVWVRKDGYVRMSYSVRRENSPGEDPIEIHYAMEKGTIVGGIVQNADGKSMAGIDLTVRVNDDEHMDKPENHVRQGVTTDKNGRWETPNCVPAQLEKVNLRTKHADYSDQNVWIETSEDIQLLRNKEYVLVVDEGYSISGVVKDEAGNPIKGARVQLGDYYFARDRQHRTHTDEDGYFDFKQLRIGNSGPHYEFVEGQGNVLVRRRFDYIAVTADGFSPETMTIYFKEKHVDLEFVMTPGDSIYGRVLDFEGSPIAGATVRADNWGRNSYDHVRTIDWNTKTDQEGRFIWKHAPSFEIQFEIARDGYMDLRTEKVKPLDTEYEFVLNPKLRVFGQVVDATTKEAISEFTFRQYEGGYISTPQTIKDSEGRFKTAFADQGEKFTISFKADGYKPTNSRSISLIEQDVELIIEMQPDAGLDGVVVDANGNPLEGVRLIIPNAFLTIDNMKFERDTPNASTDKQGRFHLDPTTRKEYSILALEETGYLFVQSINFPEDGRFVLQPYGRIEGTYYKGSQPVVNERIRIDYPYYHLINKGNGVWELGIAINYGVQTNERGKFIFDKLIHGMVRILIDPYREVEIEAGKTYEIHIGGDGLTVQGHIWDPDGEPLNEDFGKCFLEIRKIYDSLPVSEDDLPLPDAADTMTYPELL